MPISRGICTDKATQRTALSCRFQEASVPTKPSKVCFVMPISRGICTDKATQKDCFVMPISRGICTDKATQKPTQGKKREKKDAS